MEEKGRLSCPSVLKGREKGGQGQEGLANRPGCVTQARGAGKRPVLFKEEFSRESVPRLRRWGLAAPRGRLTFSDTEMFRPENPGQGVSNQHTNVSSFL